MQNADNNYIIRLHKKQHNKGKTMVVKFNKAEKVIIDALIARGHDLFCDGRGWWINDQCFASFKSYMIFLKKLK